MLRELDGLDLTLYIAGAKGTDSADIDSFDFVRDKGLINENDMKSLYRSSRIFIQNSIFETFGLAPVEALLSGCDIIVSSHCGVLEVLKDIEEGDVINDPDDPGEIAEKIRLLLKEGNNKRLVSALDKRSTSWEKRAFELCQILENLKKQKRIR